MRARLPPNYQNDINQASLAAVYFHFTTLDNNHSYIQVD